MSVTSNDALSSKKLSANVTVISLIHSSYNGGRGGPIFRMTFLCIFRDPGVHQTFLDHVCASSLK